MALVSAIAVNSSCGSLAAMSEVPSRKLVPASAVSEADNLPVQAPAEAHLDEWIAPQQCDERGHLRAGQILEWMDVVGVLAAMRHARRDVVTASVDGVEFCEPILLGERVTMTAQVAFTSARSMGVAVTMSRGVPGACARTILNGWMTFVAVDQLGRCSQVPPVIADSALARARHREGVLRREFRHKLQNGALNSDPNELPRAGQEGRVLRRELLKRLPRLRSRGDAEPRSPRTREVSYTHSIEMVRADSLNFLGKLYGGVAMRWLESNAQLSARAYLGGAPVRCNGLHGLTFLKPADRHVFVHLRSMVVHVNETQLTVLVSIESEEPSAGSVSETMRAFLTYVPALPNTKIAWLECQSDAERALFQEVEHRLALQRSLVAGPSRYAS